ncbi:hypothetical protein [Commensalibacter communis]|uniref:hypothetical protein n=1 Tax=Commensalibacter communis TaxID=2972786 RepID=UPI0022FF5A41|nr:hypothetical protein [Commensalibacter communis]CAI3958676.1 unnamed protein product [Commensalibacter communis]CAI3959676.1 unnamed protein product [Commensalibacter communis]
MSITRPGPFLSKWAEKGKRFDVPDNGADIANGKADIQTGFPEITMKSVINGGVPPWGQDHNGILYQITQAIQWTQAGGVPTFNQDFVNKNGGYPAGSILQGDDVSKPWILWISVQDENTNKLIGLDINNPSAQNGWRRYPIIEEKDGALLYYNDDGELAVATPSVSFTRYVSWSKGNDNNKGTDKGSPLKTIDKAIASSPSSGQIYIKILDTDTHYWMSSHDIYNLKDQDISNYDPGKIYSDSDGITQEPPSKLWYTIDIGSRTIIIQPYSDVEGQDFWDELLYSAQINMVDAYWGYCVDDAVLASRGIRRPVIKIMWCYGYANNEYNHFITSYIGWCGINGISNAFSIEFYGCQFETHKIDDLNNAPFGANSGWARPGGNYIFNGCIFTNFCNDLIYYKYFLGGTEITSSSISFRRSNYFVDSLTNKGPLMILINAPINIFVNDGKPDKINNTNYKFIENNVEKFMSKGSTYYPASLKKIKHPSPHYAYLTTSFDINENI